MSAKLIIHSVWTWDCPNLRVWRPPDRLVVAVTLNIDIGMKGRPGHDTFTMRLATPAGLATLPVRDGIVAVRPLLVVESFDFTAVWSWLQATVAGCARPTWQESVAELRRFFDWEYDGMS